MADTLSGTCECANFMIKDKLRIGCCVTSSAVGISKSLLSQTLKLIWWSTTINCSSSPSVWFFDHVKIKILNKIFSTYPLTTVVCPPPMKFPLRTIARALFVKAIVVAVSTTEISFAIVLALYWAWLIMRLLRWVTPPEFKKWVPTTTLIEFPARPTVQWAAETIHLFEIIEPPQKWKFARVLNETCHGISAIFAFVPPTIRLSRSSGTAVSERGFLELFSF